MKLVNKLNKLFFVLAVWGVLFLPLFACQASSGLASVWVEDSQAEVKLYMPIDTDGLANFGMFFVYLLLILGGMFALAIIMVGALKMFLASGNEDAHYGAQHTFIAGMVSFTVALVLYFSLDQVFIMLEKLALKIA